MACVCYFITLVGEREFDLETITPLIDATLDLQHFERGSGVSLSGQTRSSYCRENQGNSFIGHGVEFIAEPDPISAVISKPDNVDTWLYDGMAVWQSVLSIDEACIGLQVPRSLYVLVQDFCSPACVEPIEPYDKRRDPRFHISEEA